MERRAREARRPRTRSAPPTGCRFKCYGCDIPVYGNIYHDCYLCNDCWLFYRPFECYYLGENLYGWIID